MFLFRAGFTGKPWLVWTEAGTADSPSGLGPQQGPVTCPEDFSCPGLALFRASLGATGALLEGGTTYGSHGRDKVVPHVVPGPGGLASSLVLKEQEGEGGRYSSRDL